MIDYHCHLLPYIDDGPTSMDESILMALLLKKAGYHSVYCTPHMIRNLYEVDNKDIRIILNDFKNILIREGIALNVLEGREYLLDDNFIDYLSDLMPLEHTNIVLIEFQTNTFTGLIKDAVSAILRKGFIPLIAHPERCKLFQQNNSPVIDNHSEMYTPNRIFRLKKKDMRQSRVESKDNNEDLIKWLITNGCLFQNNLLSFLGVYGLSAHITADIFYKNNLYTHFGTDAHSEYCIQKIFFPSHLE
jgi:protein-tyrosine phosphatase